MWYETQRIMFHTCMELLVNWKCIYVIISLIQFDQYLILLFNF